MATRHTRTARPAVGFCAALLAITVAAGCSGSGEPTAGETDTELEGESLDDSASVEDPLAPYDVQIQFDITVPAYSSEELQLSVALGDEQVLASWVGDEFWSASLAFPAATEAELSVAFSDQNGHVVLGTYRVDYQTGTNTVESVVIAAGLFNTQDLDSDGDGISNLDEVIAGSDPLPNLRVLLFTETQDFRHESTEDALQALEELAAAAGIATVRADDSVGVFTDDNLANYAAVVWVMTSGDVLVNDEQAAFERFIRAGGGYAGIHAASFTEYEWPWYGALVGAYFASHPEVQSATQTVEDQTHPSTTHLNSTWTRIDEWYDYNRNPRGEVNVLLSLDETTYTGGTMPVDHPSAWYHEFDGGRSWYTGGGHTSESYLEPDFRAHLLGGLSYAAGLGN